MAAPVFIHVLSLDTVGGVESLYMHYLFDTLSRGSAIHYTCVSGKHPHPVFTQTLDKLGHKPFLEQYLMGIRLPKPLHFLIHIRRGMVQNLVYPTAWVYWNRIEGRISPGVSIYYEHGASWSLPVTKERKQFLSNISSFLANSTAASIMLREKWGITFPIQVVPNPLRPDISISTPRSIASKQKITLGYMGRLVPIKGVFIALHTLKALLEKRLPVTLLVAGVGDLESDLRKCAEHLGIAHAVTWKGAVLNVCEFYDAIDMLIVPSIREPLGLVALEAAARGVPVIASRIDGLPEVVLDGQTGVCITPSIELEAAKDLLTSRRGLPTYVVDPVRKSLVTPKLIDPSSCADAIAALWYNADEYTRLSRQAIELARGRADFHVYTDVVQNFLEKNLSATSNHSEESAES